MRYKKMKITSVTGGDRLFRTVWVPEDIGLVDLGAAICTLFRAEMEHPFVFTKGRNQYVPSSFMDFGDDEWMGDYDMADLEPSFRFTYDTGDSWTFECRVYKKTKEISSEQVIFIEDGAGLGIWEDNIQTYWAWLDGELSPDMCEDDEVNGNYMPWNLDIETLADTDAPLDLIAEEKRVNEEILTQVEHYLSLENDYADDDWDEDDEYWNPSSIDFELLAQMQPWTAFLNTLLDIGFTLDSNDPDEDDLDRLYDAFINDASHIFKPVPFQPDSASAKFYPFLLLLILECAYPLLHINGHEDEAVHILEITMDMFEEYEILYTHIGVVLVSNFCERNKEKEAEELTCRLMQKYPDNPTIHAAEIELYSMKGEYDKADELIEEYLGKKPKITNENYDLFVSALNHKENMGQEKVAAKMLKQLNKYTEDHRENVLNILNQFTSEVLGEYDDEIPF